MESGESMTVKPHFQVVHKFCFHLLRLILSIVRTKSALKKTVYTVSMIVSSTLVFIFYQQIEILRG